MHHDQPDESLLVFSQGTRGSPVTPTNHVRCVIWAKDADMPWWKSNNLYWYQSIDAIHLRSSPKQSWLWESTLYSENCENFRPSDINTLTFDNSQNGKDEKSWREKEWCACKGSMLRIFSMSHCFWSKEKSNRWWLNCKDPSSVKHTFLVLHIRKLLFKVQLNSHYHLEGIVLQQNKQ